MADKQAQALERLTAKLTALRKTLRGEERKLLDAMVLPAQSEVTAHAKSFQPIASKTAKPAALKTMDVELHSASFRKSAGPEDQKSAKPAARKSSDVELHSASFRKSAGPEDQKSAKPAARKQAGPESQKANEAEGRQWLGITLSDGNYRVTFL